MLAAAVLGLCGLAAPAQAALTAVGPIDPATSTPAWYQDSAGLKLAQCSAIGAAGPNCGVAAPGEAFYNFTTSHIDLPNGGVADLTLNVTVAPNATNDPSVFNRVRIQIQGAPAGDYTITHPYGTDTVNVASAGARGRTTNDIGCLVAGTGPCNFALALAGPFGPFLTPVAPAPAPPAGFIGDGVTAGPVAGSPTGNNFFRVDGPGIPVTGAQSNDFVVVGKLAGPPVPVFGSSGNLAYGNQLITTASATKRITVKSNGVPGVGSDLTIKGVTKTGADAADYSIVGDTCTGHAAMPSGTTCTVDVALTPSASGARDAAITIADNTAAGTHSVALTGTGTVPPVFSSTGDLAYPDQLVGTLSATRTVTVTNSGAAGPGTGLTISGTSVAGSAPSDYSILVDTCKGRTLAAGGTCTVGVAFTPGALGARGAALTFKDNTAAGSHSIGLNGNGVNPVSQVLGVQVKSPALRIGTLVLPSRLTRHAVLRTGLTIRMVVPSGANHARINVYRVVGGKQRLISSRVRSVRPGVTTVRLADSALRRKLRHGTYRITVRPGSASGGLGAVTSRTFRITG